MSEPDERRNPGDEIRQLEEKIAELRALAPTETRTSRILVYEQLIRDIKRGMMDHDGFLLPTGAPNAFPLPSVEMEPISGGDPTGIQTVPLPKPTRAWLVAQVKSVAHVTLCLTPARRAKSVELSLRSASSAVLAALDANDAVASAFHMWSLAAIYNYSYSGALIKSERARAAVLSAKAAKTAASKKGLKRAGLSEQSKKERDEAIIEAVYAAMKTDRFRWKDTLGRVQKDHGVKKSTVMRALKGANIRPWERSE